MLRATMTAGVLVLAFFTLGARGEESPAPDGWQTYSPREATRPQFRVQKQDAGTPHAYCLGISGGGHPAPDGRWVRKTPVAAGKHYAVRAEFLAKDVATPTRSVFARLVWIDGQGNAMAAAEHVATTAGKTPDGWSIAADVFQAPDQAAAAQIELHLRWAPQGDVLWRGVALAECGPPKPRLVRLAAVNHRPRGAKTPGENLKQFVAPLEEAARRKADVVCLGEGITVCGTGKKYAEVAEPVPGPSTGALGELAARHKLYVVAGLYEQAGKLVHNTAVLIGRDGRLVGKYRKVCLPREEIDGGITPGTEYPVFETDFGRVGLMICWDVHFPEVARELSARGAEVILLPIWGGNETLARARALENQVFLVASGYDFRTAIYDKRGEPLAAADKDPQVLVCEVDLGRKVYWPWLGDWRGRIWREGPARSEAN